MTIVMKPTCWHQNFGPNGLSAPAQGLCLNVFSSITADFNISSAIRWAIQDQWSSGFFFFFFFFFFLLLLERGRFGGGSLLVWCEMMIVIQGSLNARRYIDDVLRPRVTQFLHNKGSGVTFQSDNARPKTALITRQFLAQNNVDVLSWPAVSPDMNLVEHV